MEICHFYTWHYLCVYPTLLEVEQLCQDGEDTSLERVGALLIESFEEVFGLEAIPIDDLA